MTKKKSAVKKHKAPTLVVCTTCKARIVVVQKGGDTSKCQVCKSPNVERSAWK